LENNVCPVSNSLFVLGFIRWDSAPPCARQIPDLLLADETHQNESALGSTPDADPTDNHGIDGRNVAYTDGHVQWKNGPKISDLFQEIVDDYNAQGCAVQTLD